MHDPSTRTDTALRGTRAPNFNTSENGIFWNQRDEGVQKSHCVPGNL